MTLAELRQHILNAIGDDLGTYTTASDVSEEAATLQAIWIAPPQTPAGFKCDGLECIVQADPEERGMNVASGDSMAMEYWTFRLVQWDESKRLYNVKQKLRNYFRSINYNATATDIPATRTNYAQCVFKIFDPVWISQGR